MMSVQEPAFGDLLRYFRDEAGLSRVDLAVLTKMSPETIGALERGTRRRPYPETIARLVRALDLSARDRALLESAAKQPRGVRTPAALQGATTAALRLIGRDSEWKWLWRGLRGPFPLLLLVGEPGIGKTRLLREAKTWSRDHDWRVLWGGFRQVSGGEPYAPILEAIERSAHSLPADQRADGLEDCAWLARLLPELSDELGPLDTPPGWSPEHEQRLMFNAVERYLENIAGPSGTLLVLDDLQRAGGDALRLLERLVRSRGARRILVLGAYRSTDVRTGNPLSALVTDLAKDQLVARLDLKPLKPGDAATLVNLLLGEIAYGDGTREADAPETSALVKDVVARTGGIPFFLVSCARLLRARAEQAAEGASDDQRQTAAARALRRAQGLGAMGEIPWDVAESVVERVARLPEAAQSLLHVAAVVGERAPRALLTAIAGLPEHEALSGLEAACYAGLLVEDEHGGQETYSFQHDVIREVIAASLATPRRTALHRDVAAALEPQVERHPAATRRAHERLVARLAHHYAHGRMPDKAVLYLRPAGDQAREKYAHLEAATCYATLADCLDDLERGREAAEARRDQATMLTYAGRYAEALVPLALAEESYRELGDVEQVAVVVAAIASTHAANGASDVGLAYLQPLTEGLSRPKGSAAAGGAAVAAVAPRARAWLLGTLAHLNFMAGRYDEALRAAQSALEVACAIRDPLLLAHTRLGAGVALLAVGKASDAATLLGEAIEAAEAAGDQPTLADALRMALWAHQTRGDFKSCRALQERALEKAQDVGNLACLGHTFFFQGLLAYYTGHWNEARSLAASAASQFGDIEVSPLGAYPPLGLGWLCLVSGQREEAMRYLEQAQAIARRSEGDQVLRFATALLAEEDLVNGRGDAACARLDPLFAAKPLQERTRLELRVLRAWAALETGAHDEADATARDCVERAQANDLRLLLPDAWRIQALCDLRRGRWADAEAALDRALDLCDAMPYPYAKAKALLVCGQLWLARAQPRRAREHLERAQAICADLGERLYGEVIERDLAALAVGDAVSPTSAGYAPGVDQMDRS
jgi:tetratricopeptide (TPR) repeat protein/transcriptional regulator with XRE-family HTH domain